MYGTIGLIVAGAESSAVVRDVAIARATSSSYDDRVVALTIASCHGCHPELGLMKPVLPHIGR